MLVTGETVPPLAGELRGTLTSGVTMTSLTAPSSPTHSFPPRRKHASIPPASTVDLQIRETMASDFVATILGAVQASLSVLITIAIGVAAAQFGFLDGETSRRVSQLSVEVFLPLLLLTNIGSEINLETAVRYLPVLSADRPPAIFQRG